MRTALAIARKEARDLLREGRLTLAVALVTLLLVAAVVAARGRQAATRTERAQTEGRSRKQWEAHRNVDPHSAAHYGIWVYKPVAPLAVLDPGLDPYVGVSAHLVAHTGATPQNAPVLAENRYARWAEPTAAAVVLLLLPLVIVVAGVGAVVDERANGTLRQTLAEGVSRPAFALGKLVGLGGTLLALLLPAAILAGLLAAREGDARAAALWALAAGLYLTTWVGLTLAVSALASGRAAAALALLAFYAVSALVVPRVATERAAALFPTPTLPELQAAVRKGQSQERKEFGDYEAYHRAMVARLAKRYGFTKTGALAVDPEGFELNEGEEMSARVRDRVYAPVDRAYAAQDAFVAAALAPSCAFGAVSATLSGTDGAAQRRFERATELYRRDWVHRLNLYLALHSRPGKYDVAPAALFRSIPPFAYRPAAPTPQTGFIRLFAWASASLLLAFVGAAFARPEAA